MEKKKIKRHAHHIISEGLYIENIVVVSLIGAVARFWDSGKAGVSASRGRGRGGLRSGLQMHSSCSQVESG